MKGRKREKGTNMITTRAKRRNSIHYAIDPDWLQPGSVYDNNYPSGLIGHSMDRSL